MPGLLAVRTQAPQHPAGFHRTEDVAQHHKMNRQQQQFAERPIVISNLQEAIVYVNRTAFQSAGVLPGKICS